MTALLQLPLRTPCSGTRQAAASPRGGRGFGHKEHKEHKGGWELCARCVICGQKGMEGASRGGKVFQPLEKKFPIIGKNGGNFPTIGKIFSNHWKNAENFFQSLENGRKIFPIAGKLLRAEGGAP